MVYDVLHCVDPGFDVFRRTFLEFLDRVVRRSGETASIATFQELNFLGRQHREFWQHAFGQLDRLLFLNTRIDRIEWIGMVADDVFRCVRDIVRCNACRGKSGGDGE